MGTHIWDLDKKYRKKINKLLDETDTIELYEQSIHQDQKQNVLFIVREGTEKYLMVDPTNEKITNQEYDGRIVEIGSESFLKCALSHYNARIVRSQFRFTNPVLIGKVNSYGFGDRLGNAGPAHVRAVAKTDFQPVLAQQSIRELERTKRTAKEVLDAATWAVLQEGYHNGFGADGDHLKTTDDIDRMVDAGYTMFTIDPSDYVVNDVKDLDEETLQKQFEQLPWDDLQDTPESLLNRFTDLSVELSDDYTIEPGREEVLQGMVKYGQVVNHARMMSEYLDDKYPGHDAELELSVDETEEPTTLFEHYLVASELDRLGVELVSLAPRFCGDFEKGIDFKGDLDQFREEYIQHLKIAELFGGYKLSVHSGSDKFSVYEVVGSMDLGAVHVKTAGTSYLEALRTIAETDTDLFREILAFSVSRFEEDRKTYHISADLDAIPDPKAIPGEELPNLLDDNDTRQVLHVAYGSVLSGEQEEAATFKERLMEALELNEELHYENLMKHFDKHLSPFEQ